MAKDVWITDFSTENDWYGAGVGGLMARKGIAEATFGADRVLVLDKIFIGDKGFGEYMVLMRQQLQQVFETHGAPKFFICGWQDMEGCRYLNKIFEYGEDLFGQRPVTIGLGDADPDITDVIISNYSDTTSGTKYIKMAGIPHIVNDQTLQKFRDAAYYNLPNEMRDKEFITLLVGEAQERTVRCDKERNRDTTELFERVAHLCEDKGLNLVVITSPRTMPNTITALFEAKEKYSCRGSTQSVHIYEYTDFDDKANPYPGILALPNNKLAIVTEDTMSMICEVIASPVPITVWSPWKQKHDYNEILIDSFDERGFILPINEIENTTPIEWAKRKVVFNTTTETAVRLSRNLFARNLASASDLPLLRNNDSRLKLGFNRDIP